MEIKENTGGGIDITCSRTDANVIMQALDLLSTHRDWSQTARIEALKMSMQIKTLIKQ